MDCCKAKNLNLILHKIKGHSGNEGNDLADSYAKKGIEVTSSLQVPETTYMNFMFVPKWKDQIIDSSLRAFVNITTAAIYETEWSELGKMLELINQEQKYTSHEKLFWNNTWQVLKKRQGKRCISLKKSKALIFRIKCINNILPTKDICFQRKPKLYKDQKCIACYKANESLYHIAECEVYQGIWKKLEEEALQLTRLEVLTKLDILLNEISFREAIYNNEPGASMHNRKMHLRGLTCTS
jgi:hypothetical protein